MRISTWQVRHGGADRTDRQQLLSCLALVCWVVKQEHPYHSTPSAVLANRLLYPLEQARVSRIPRMVGDTQCAS
jgi:hypothetical protein